MPNAKDLAPLLVCSGKDCMKKQKPAFRNLLATASDAGLSVEMVSCQGACTGPTAVVIAKNGPRWFEDLKGSKVQSELCDFASGQVKKPKKRLAKRELTGKSRAKAANRLAKQTS